MDVQPDAPAAPQPNGAGPGPVPASFAQERLWLIDVAAPGSATYNVPLFTRWYERVDPTALGVAMTSVVARHEALRTTYRLDDGQLFQVVAASAPVPVEVIPFDPERADVQLATRARQPFDLATGPVLRCTVWQGAPDGDLMLLAIHHVAVDGWSLATLYHDLDEAYRAALAGERPDLPGLPICYADFARWDRRTFAGRERQDQLDARVAELRDSGNPLVLAGARPTTATAGERPGRQEEFQVPTALWSDVLALARTMRATPFVVLSAGFQAVLQRWSGREEFVIGAVTANRPYPDVEQLVGFFVNTVPLRCQVDLDWTFRELCRRTRAEAYRALTYQWIPFDRLTAKISAVRPYGHSQLVNVCLALQNMPHELPAPTRWSPPVVLPTGTAKFDLLLTIEATTDQVLATVEYDTNLYPGEVCRGIAGNFLELLAGAAVDADVPLRLLPLTAVPESLRLAPDGPAFPASAADAVSPDQDAGLTADQQRAAQLFAAALAATNPGAPRARRTELLPTSNFFALGGNSLLAVTMVTRASRQHGVRLSPRDFLADPTVAGFARLLAAEGKSTSEEWPGAQDPAAADRHLATSTQERFWFLDRIPELRTAYLLPSVVELRGAVDVAELSAALDLVLARHPALHSRFEFDRKQCRVHYRTDMALPPVQVTSASGWSPSRLRDHLATLCWTGFDLARDAPVRAEIVVAGPTRTLLVLVVPHIVADGWSRMLLLDQVASAYGARLASRTPLLAASVHPSALQHGPATGNTEDVVAWLAGAPTDIELPYDRPRPALQSTLAGSIPVALEPDLSARLRAVAAESACTTFMAVAALLGATLARRSAQRDFIFAIPWAGRDNPEGAAAVAMLMNTLALRVDLRGTRTWPDLLSRVRDSSAVSYRNADASFDAIVAALQSGRDLSRPPLTPVYLGADDGLSSLPGFAGDLRARYLPLDPLHIKHELELTVSDDGDRLTFDIAYAVALFDPGTIAGLADSLVATATDLAMNPATPPA